MRCELEWDADRRVVYKRYSDVVGYDDWQRTREETLAIDGGRAIAAARSVVIDYTDASLATTYRAQVDAVDAYLRTMVPLNPKLTVVFIMPGPVEYGLCRMLQAKMDERSWRIELVRSRDEAERWLEGRADPAPEDAGSEPEAQ